MEIDQITSNVHSHHIHDHNTVVISEWQELQGLLTEMVPSSVECCSFVSLVSPRVSSALECRMMPLSGTSLPNYPCWLEGRGAVEALSFPLECRMVFSGVGWCPWMPNGALEWCVPPELSLMVGRAVRPGSQPGLGCSPSRPSQKSRSSGSKMGTEACGMSASHLLCHRLPLKVLRTG